MTLPPVPGPPPPGADAGTVTEPDRAVAELAAALPSLPLAEHHDRLTAVQELLQRTLDEVRADR